MKCTKYMVSTPPFQDADGDIRRIIMSTRTGRRINLSEEAWRYMQEAPDKLSENTWVLLAKEGFLPQNPAGEGEEVLKEMLARLNNQSTFSLTLLPTAQCQLACVYCNQRHTPRRMSAATQEAVVAMTQAVLDEGRTKQLRLCWFGAEALLAADIVCELGARLKALAETRGVNCVSTLVTNGLALDAEMTVRLMASQRMEMVDLTLDGTGEQHDQQRPQRGGNGSFKKILANLKEIREAELDLPLSLRCNVSKENQDTVTELIDLLVASGLRGMIRRFYCAPVHDWGGPARGDGAGDGQGDRHLGDQRALSETDRGRVAAFADPGMRRRRMHGAKNQQCSC